MSLYPEHKKLALIADQNRAVGDFLDWLLSKGVILASRDGERLWAYQYSTTNLLAEFFEIDLDLIEREKREILTVISQMEPV